MTEPVAGFSFATYTRGHWRYTLFLILGELLSHTSDLWVKTREWNLSLLLFLFSYFLSPSFWSVLTWDSLSWEQTFQKVAEHCGTCFLIFGTPLTANLALCLSYLIIGHMSIIAVSYYWIKCNDISGEKRWPQNVIHAFLSSVSNAIRISHAKLPNFLLKYYMSVKYLGWQHNILLGLPV